MAAPEGARDGKVSLTPDSDTEPKNGPSGAEDSAPRAGNEQLEGRLDVRILKDVERFQEMECAFAGGPGNGVCLEEGREVWLFARDKP